MIRSILLLTLTLGLTAQQAAADWRLDSEASTLGFSSVKNGSIVEPHLFKSVSGGVAASGEAHLDIDLASVDTMIPIRDQRMRDILFKVAEFPSARFETTVPLADIDAMDGGESRDISLKGTLSLHGQQVDTMASVRVSKTGSGDVIVTTTRPIVVSAASFGLVSGLSQLQEIAGLESITPMVPVSFTLVFKNEDE